MEAIRTLMVVVNCCFCGKDLTDALSQERGYGPICAKKYGLLLDTTEEPTPDVEERIQAAVLMTSDERKHLIEKVQADWRENKKTAAKRLAYCLSFIEDEQVTDVQLRALEGMGFVSMAGIIANIRCSDAVVVASKRKCKIEVKDTRWGEKVFVYTPEKPKGNGLAEVREIPGRRWDREDRANTFPVTSWDTVMTWVLRYFPLTDVPEKPESADAEPSKPKVAEGQIVRLGLNKQDRITIESPYDRAFVEAIKAMPERQWTCATCGKPGRPKCEDHENGPHIWTLPIDRAEALQDLAKKCYPLTKRVMTPELAKRLKEQAERLELAAAVDGETITLPGGDLYGFQSAGVAYLERANGRAILADEQGLGKTVQAIAYVKRNMKPGERCLYVVPSNVKFNWFNELTKWLTGTKADRKALRATRKGTPVSVNGTNAVVLKGRPSKAKREKLLKDPTSAVATHTIINWDILTSWKEVLKAAGFSIVIGDEAHRISNEKSGRSKAFAHVVDADEEGYQGIDKVILLTGTPILNRPKNLWNLLKTVAADVWGNFFRFMKRYAGAYQTKWGWNFEGSSNEEELHDRLNGHIWIRRLKSEVLKDLPPKQKHEVLLNIDGAARRAYEEAESHARVTYNESGNLAVSSDFECVLEAITMLRVAIGQAKIEAATDWIRDLRDSVGKVVVFARHQEVVNSLTESLGALKVDGSVTGLRRTETVEEFQTNPDQKVIVCSIEAASEGITLTESQHVVFVERTWRDRDHEQASDRIHRIGQTGQATVWYLDCPDTFDEALEAVHNWKGKRIDAIVDGKPLVDGVEYQLQELQKVTNPDKASVGDFLVQTVAEEPQITEKVEALLERLTADKVTPTAAVNEVADLYKTVRKESAVQAFVNYMRGRYGEPKESK
jgi:SWI/SNF-related matrix-associated actin-dependent regulator 1 of chromatin subfamily A